MSKIDYIINERAHIPIRNRVALILTDEMMNQSAMTYDTDFELPFYIQRYKPVTPDECPIGVVSLGSGKYDNRTVEKADGTVDVLIDIYTKGFSTSEHSGDVISSFQGHKIASIVMGVLENPIYKRLDFAPPFIQSCHIDGFESGDVERNDAVSMYVVRVTLNVKYTQAEQLIDPIPIGGNDTQVKLGETDKGFLYIFNS